MEPHQIDLFNLSRGVLFTHPLQLFLWRQAGFGGRYLIRPIGSRKAVAPPTFLPKKPTIGFFCGETKKGTKGSSELPPIVTEARKYFDFNCLLIGKALEAISFLGKYEIRAAGPDDYGRIDVLICLSQSPGVPLSVYEACAAGKPVLTTPRWFPDKVPPSVTFAQTRDEFVKNIITLLRKRKDNFERRRRLSFAPYIFEDWIELNVRQANGWQ